MGHPRFLMTNIYPPRCGSRTTSQCDDLNHYASTNALYSSESDVLDTIHC